MADFLTLSTGAIVNLDQVVQLTPEGALQLTSGNTMHLSPRDVMIVAIAAATEKTPAPAKQDLQAKTRSGADERSDDR